MKLTQLEKAQKLYDRVKELDKEIMEIEKTAELIATKKTEIKLSLKVSDLEPKKHEKEPILDADGSLINNKGSQVSPWRLIYGTLAPKPEQEKEYASKIANTIPDNLALQLLGVLLADKSEARNLAIKALNKIGIDI
jgi:hypothetical protein